MFSPPLPLLMMGADGSAFAGAVLTSMPRSNLIVTEIDMEGTGSSVSLGDASETAIMKEVDEALTIANYSVTYTERRSMGHFDVWQAGDYGVSKKAAAAEGSAKGTKTLIKVIAVNEKRPFYHIEFVKDNITVGVNDFKYILILLL